MEVLAYGVIRGMAFLKVEELGRVVLNEAQTTPMSPERQGAKCCDPASGGGELGGSSLLAILCSELRTSFSRERLTNV